MHKNIVSMRAVVLQEVSRTIGCGTDFIRRVRERTGGEIALHVGNTYVALSALEDAGLVKKCRPPAGTPDVRGGRPRQFYRVTARGRMVAEKERQVGLTLFLPNGSSVVASSLGKKTSKKRPSRSGK